MKSLSSWFANFLDSFLGKYCIHCKRTRTLNANCVCDECEEDLETDRELLEKMKIIMYCPSCDKVMKPKKIKIGMRHPVVVHSCEMCGGMFIDGNKLGRIQNLITEEIQEVSSFQQKISVRT